MMSRSATIMTIGLGLGLLCADARAQEMSTEAACIAVLRRTVDRLNAIDRQVTGLNQICSANSDALDRAKRGLEAETRRTADLTQENSKLRTEAENWQRQTTEQARRLAALQDRLKSLNDQIGSTVASRVREALSGSRASCESLDVGIDADGAVKVSGRLLKADEVKRRVTEIANSVAGAVVKTDGLVKVDVCGQPIGDGWVIEVGDSGLRRAGYGEIAADADAAVRLPEGTVENCKIIGAKLDALRQSDVEMGRTFWSLRPGSASSPHFGYCQSSSEKEGWRYSENSVPQVRALVVQRSN